MQIADSGSSSPSEWRRHGLVLVPATAGIALVSLHGYSLGVMMAPLQHEFGWSRTGISAGPMIISMISLLLSPFVGVAIDRLGPRPIAIGGVSAYIALLALVATATADIRSWWWHYALLGLASTTLLPTVWTAAINARFDVHRGKALAIALLGTGIGATFWPSLASKLIDHWGWRGAYVGMAAIVGSVTLALVAALFRDPGLRKGAQAGSTIAAAGMTRGEGFRSPAFARLAIGVFVFGITTLALTINAVPVLETRGLDRGTAAAVAGLLGIGSILGRLGGGFLLDRFDAARVAAIAVLMPVAAIALLLAPGTVATAGAAMLLLGLALGTEVDACSYLAARHFGMRSFGALFGTINGIVAFGAGVAPVVANFVYDLTRSYDPVLWASVPLCLVASGLFATLGPYPDFARHGGRPSTEPAPTDPAPLAA
jgi:MFS family permease